MLPNTILSETVLLNYNVIKSFYIMKVLRGYKHTLENNYQTWNKWNYIDIRLKRLNDFLGLDKSFIAVILLLLITSY